MTSTQIKCYRVRACFLIEYQIYLENSRLKTLVTLKSNGSILFTDRGGAVFGHDNGECRSPAFLALDGDFAAVSFYYLLYN